MKRLLDGKLHRALCGSKKSMARGLPIASVLFAPALVGGVVLPLMLFISCS